MIEFDIANIATTILTPNLVAAESVIPYDLDWREALMDQLYPQTPAATIK